jgi:hypothetical protein
MMSRYQTLCHGLYLDFNTHFSSCFTKHRYRQYFQANGDVFSGTFQDDQRHVCGIYRTQNGQCFNVVYHQNELISSEEIKNEH